MRLLKVEDNTAVTDVILRLYTFAYTLLFLLYHIFCFFCSSFGHCTGLCLDTLLFCLMTVRANVEKNKTTWKTNGDKI